MLCRPLLDAWGAQARGVDRVCLGLGLLQFPAPVCGPRRRTNELPVGYSVLGQVGATKRGNLFADLAGGKLCGPQTPVAPLETLSSPTSPNGARMEDHGQAICVI